MFTVDLKQQYNNNGSPGKNGLVLHSDRAHKLVLLVTTIYLYQSAYFAQNVKNHHWQGHKVLTAVKILSTGTVVLFYVAGPRSATGRAPDL